MTYYSFHKSYPAQMTKLLEREVGEEHVTYAYHLRNKLCERDSSAYKNDQCVKNPNCFISLGEEEREKKKDEEVLAKRLGPNPNILLKSETDLFVGLKNLGATCYMNSLLQSLYHNTTFRQGIYAWKPETESTQNLEDVCMQLKILFSHLQLGNQKHFAPYQFAKCLNIRTGEQQDAQEFYKLFIAYLEGRFANSSEPTVKTLIRDQFVGKQAYITQCSRCARVSEQEEDFYDLPLHIEGKRSIEDSLEEYFKKETLEGYLCEKCGTKDGSASRHITTKSLPPVLNVTLLRFVFDKETSNKKKLLNEVRFPLTLNMSRYLEKPGDDEEYSLHSIICHCGPSAYGGHYIAYAHDVGTGKWWKFDDEHVTACTEFPFTYKSTSLYDYPMSIGFGHNTSTNDKNKNETPYMLIYQKTSHARQMMVDPKPPETAMPFVETETSQLFEAIQKYNEDSNGQLAIIQAEKAKFQELHRSLQVKNPRTKDYFWIDVDWLKRWIKGEENLGPIDNSKLLCEHGKVSRKHTLRKRITMEAWEELHRTYGGGPALTHFDTCIDCTQSWFARKKAKRDGRTEKEKVLRECAYYHYDNGYWISKNWFESWKTAAPKETLISNMNFDIVCCHGRMSPDTSARMVIPVNSWSYLRSQHEDPDLVEFPAPATKPCEECRESEKQNNEMQRKIRAERSVEKNNFSYLYEIKTPTNRLKRVSPGKTYCVISLPWLKKWWDYVNEPARESPGPIDNTMFVCEHNMMVYSIEEAIIEEDKDNTPFDYIPEHQWTSIFEKYGGGPELKFHVQSFEHSYVRKRTVELVTEPNQCMPCTELRLAREREARINFHDEEIIIKEGSEYGHVTYTKKNVKVSCDTTIETLKVAVFQHLNIPIFQQMLWFGEVLLSEPKLTLKDYGIQAGASILAIKVPEAEAFAALDRESADLDALYRKAPEQGFQGTSLTGGPITPSPSTKETKDVEMREPMEIAQTTVQPPPATPEPDSKWACGRCTYINDGTAFCEMCEGERIN